MENGRDLVIPILATATLDNNTTVFWSTFVYCIVQDGLSAVLKNETCAG